MKKVKIIKTTIFIIFIISTAIFNKANSQAILSPYDDQTQNWIFGNGKEPNWLIELVKGSHNIPEDKKFILKIPISESGATYDAYVDSNATIERVNDQLIITPDEDYNGLISVNFNLDLSFILNVKPVNDSPIFSETSNQTVDEDTEFSLQLFAVDMDGDILTYGASIDGNGQVNTIEDMIYVTPNKNYNGPILVTTAVSDSKETQESKFLLNVISINDPPVLFAIDSQAIVEDTSLRLVLEASDVDGDSLFYSALTDSNARIDVQNNQLLIIPNKNYNGSLKVLVSVTDGSLKDETTFQTEIIPIKDAPVLTSISNQSIPEDTSLKLLLSAIDADGDKLTYRAESKTDSKITINNNQLKITPIKNYNGDMEIFVFADDGSEVDTTNFILTVTPINDAPLLTSITPIYSNSKNLNIELSSMDIDGDQVSFSAKTNNTAKVDISKNMLTVKPNKNFSGSLPITLSTFDGNSTVDTNITLINPLPGIFGIAPQSMYEDTNLILDIFAKDPEDDPFSFKSRENANAKIIIKNNRLRISPLKNYYGPLKIYIIVSDKKDSTEFNFNIEVLNVDDKPIAFAGEDINLSDGCEISITLDGTKSYDVDNDQLKYKWEFYNKIPPMIYNSPIAVQLISDSSIDRKYLAVLTVTDDTGLSNLDSIFINIKNDIPPLADAGVDFIAPYNKKIYLDGTNSIDSDSELLFEWSVLDGDIKINDSQENEKKPYFLYPKQIKESTDFVFQLKTYDNNKYCSDFDTVIVTCLSNTGFAKEIKYDILSAINKENKVFIELDVTNESSWPFDFAAFTLLRLKDSDNIYGQFDPYEGENTVKYGLEKGETVNVNLVYNFKEKPKNVILSCRSSMRVTADSINYNFNF